MKFFLWKPLTPNFPHNYTRCFLKGQFSYLTESAFPIKQRSEDMSHVVEQRSFHQRKINKNVCVSHRVNCAAQRFDAQISKFEVPNVRLCLLLQKI